MKTCSIVGCTCEGTNDARKTAQFRSPNPHRPMKAYENGFTYYAASYSQRYGEPSGSYVSLVPGRAKAAAEASAEFERQDLTNYCDDENCAGCSLCQPDIIAGPEFTYQVKDLFSPAKLREHRRALLRGEVVYLSR